ncbi:hypothetical protein KP509_09G013400 [Ceratopteris richardii]|uniref:Cyclin-like domain-containing protein n=1 Tax=Ceratopteris richardii TaxID=49495 RepID=A0A8T2U490_CERRI|nr:hypothetical protein KP509_09G013400 [Ceratopteris richardii]
MLSSSSEGAEIFFSREEIDKCSPSRRDGIDVQKETFLRYSYCSFLQTLGIRLQLPQTTIATAMVLCHRFFLRRSHAYHDRFVIATSALFLAAKSEETPRPLNSFVLVSYEMCHRQDLASFNYNMPKDWFEHYKERILEAEQSILTALDFEISVEHPYTQLVSVLNKNGLLQSNLFNIAWKFVNDGLRSSLWLQFKPNHIAAGAAFLAARTMNMNLLMSGGSEWWQDFQTSPVILDTVVRQMLELYG